MGDHERYEDAGLFDQRPADSCPTNRSTRPLPSSRATAAGAGTASSSLPSATAVTSTSTTGMPGPRGSSSTEMLPRREQPSAVPGAGKASWIGRPGQRAPWSKRPIKKLQEQVDSATDHPGHPTAERGPPSSARSADQPCADPSSLSAWSVGIVGYHRDEGGDWNVRPLGPVRFSTDFLVMERTDRHGATTDAKGDRRPPQEMWGEGGDPACWTGLLCAECGAVLDGGPHRQGCSPAGQQ